jgi:integrase
VAYRRSYSRNGEAKQSRGFYFRVEGVEVPAGVENKRDAELIERRVRRIMDRRRAGDDLDPQDAKWARDDADPRLVSKLTHAGVLPESILRQRTTPGEALARYLTHQRDLGVTAKQLSAVELSVSRLVEARGRWDDLTAERVARWLAGMRTAAGGPVSATTRRNHLHRAHAWAAWCVKLGMAPPTLLEALKDARPATRARKAGDGRRRIHEPLTEEELTRLLTATLASSRWGKMDSEERAAFYALAAHTGLRVGALRGLRRRDLRLDEAPFMLTLPAGLDKAGRERRIELGDVELVGLLRRLLATSHPEARVFPRLPSKPHAMFYRDLRDAGIEPVVDKVRVRDLHGLRATTASIMARRGASLKQIQERLGHATLDLTANVYAHAQDVDRTRATSLAPSMKLPSSPA